MAVKVPRLTSTVAQAALVAALTTALYSMGLAASPPHLTHDEIKFALQAKSIADTARDVNGRLLPLYFLEPGFSVGRDPLCIYVMAGVLRILPLTEASIRFSTAIVGGLGVGLIFILARLLFVRRATAWLVAAILATSPTYYIHSRLALSVLYPVPFTILWLIASYLYLQGHKYVSAYVVGAVLGLGVYSYLAAALMMPLYLVVTMTLLAVLRDHRGVRRAAVGFSIMMLPIALWQLVEPERYANILSAYRLYDTQDVSPAGRLQQILSASNLVKRADVLWAAFSPTSLFLTGESSVQISTREVGSLLTPVALLLIVGLRAISQQPVVKPPASTETGEAPRWQGATTENIGPIFEEGATQPAGMHRRSNAGGGFATGCQTRATIGWVLLVGLLSAPLPAVIMADVEIRRWLVFVPFVAMIAGFGVERLMRGTSRARALCAVMVLLMALQFAGFTRDYFGPYRERSSLWFGGNIRAALQAVLTDARATPPAEIYIAAEIPWVDAYWAFYAKVNEQDFLLQRTRYLRVISDEVPRAVAGAVMVAPANDAAISAKLLAAGWVQNRGVADLDGSPSIVIMKSSS